MSCQGWLRSSRVAQQPLLSRPCQGWSQGSCRRRLGTAKKLGHVIGVASVAVGTKLALAVPEMIGGVNPGVIQINGKILINLEEARISQKEF